MEKLQARRSYCHIHLIPRRKHDVEDLGGGVRNVIPARAAYL